MVSLGTLTTFAFVSLALLVIVGNINIISLLLSDSDHSRFQSNFLIAT